MDLKGYHSLRKKIIQRDFEGRNRKLNKWLYIATYFSNIVSIFFAFFFLFPALQQGFLTNLLEHNLLANIFAGVMTIGFLVLFEVVKRIVIHNFSFDYMWVGMKNMLSKTVFWLLSVMCIVGCSFYFSVGGSVNFASSITQIEETQRVGVQEKIDSLEKEFQKTIKPYQEDINHLRENNQELRNQIAETPHNFLTARREYRENIEENNQRIEVNNEIIKNYREEFDLIRDNIKGDLKEETSRKISDNYRMIILLIVFVFFNESLIIGGIYFREFYEYKLYGLNTKKYEKHYVKKDRYIKLLKYIYNNGKLDVGDKVMGATPLKDLIRQKARIKNPNNFVNEFLHDMGRFGIFVLQGKRRYIIVSYKEALNIINNLDEDMILLEEIK